jgi:hypothetical protein
VGDVRPSFAVLAVTLLVLIGLSGCGRVRTDAQGRPVTLEGEIIDPQCYFTHGGRGLAHRSCAIYCARGGQDLAFLNRAGDRMIPLVAARHGANPNDAVLRYVGYPVVVQGMFFDKGGQRVLRVDLVHRLDGGPEPSEPDTARMDPMMHPMDSTTVMRSMDSTAVMHRMDSTTVTRP